MAVHKYAVGESVRFLPDRRQLGSARGFFDIVRLLPEAESMLQYRVRSKADGHERVVWENQLERS